MLMSDEEKGGRTVIGFQTLITLCCHLVIPQKKIYLFHKYMGIKVNDYKRK